MRGLLATCAAAVATLALLLGVPVRAEGQASLCTSPMMQRGLDRIAPFDYPLLYDGISPLKQPPSTPVAFSATAGCVLLTVQLSEEGGEYVVDFRPFFRRVDTVPDGGPTDPDWAFYEPANACRR